MYDELLKIEAIPLLDGPEVIKNRELQSSVIYEHYRNGVVEVLDRPN